MSAQKLFEIGGTWIARINGRPSLYRFWYDKRSGEIRRREAIATAEEKSIRRITRYTLRHFMAARIRGLEKIKVDREQRSLWPGHGKRDATSWYESHDPEYLKECSRATSAILEQIDALTRRPLVPLSVRQRKELATPAVVNGQR